MSKPRYQDLSVLVADDFSNFRSTVNTMLLDLGVEDVDTASNGEEVIEKCKLKIYDVVLCDYNLGPGRNGQHVLEELRFHGSLSPASIFIMVSAETSRNIVMSAYDCEPDDYLMKPITGLMLQQRMKRMLMQKQILQPVYKALNEHDHQTAVDLLINLSLAEDRYSGAAQKMLGQLFIDLGELQKAEKLYTRALEARPRDWARLGLAKVKNLKGELEVAGNCLDLIVDDNPLYLPAYDVLADNWDRRGARDKVQATIERAVDVSPMSILRQKRLAKIASENEDMTTAVEALRKTIKLGRLSCYGTPQDNFELTRLVSNAMENNLDLPAGAREEAMQALNTAKKEFQLGLKETIQMHLVEGRMLANEGKLQRARACLESATNLLTDVEPDIDTEVDLVDLLLSLEDQKRADELLVSLQKKYADNQKALEKLDRFLAEPASDSNRQLVATVNREGIDLYNDGEFENAIACFEKARKLFPKHVGIQLNIAQSLLGKLQENPDIAETWEQCRSVLLFVEPLIDKHHAQYDRFSRLKKRSEKFS